MPFDCHLIGVVASRVDGSSHPVEIMVGEEPQAILLSSEDAPHRQPQAGSFPSKYVVPPKRRTFGPRVRVLYHLTARGEDIKESGEMLRGSRGLAGGGIYFADSPDTCRAKALSNGYIIKARVLVGKAKVVSLGPLNLGAIINQYDFTSLQGEGFDSLQIEGLRTGDEFIVYNKDQVELISVRPDA